MIKIPKTIWEDIYVWFDYHNIKAYMISDVVIHPSYDTTPNSPYNNCSRYGVNVEIAPQYRALIGRGGVGFSSNVM